MTEIVNELPSATRKSLYEGKGFVRDPTPRWIPHWFYTSAELFYVFEMRRTSVWHYNGDLKSRKIHPVTKEVIDQDYQRNHTLSINSPDF